MKNTVALLPYYGDPSWEHVKAVFASGIRSIELAGCPWIDQARNILVAHALEYTEADVLLFIDGDISFERVSAQQVIDAARESGGVVGAAYSTKSLGGKIVGVPADLSAELGVYEVGAIYPATHLGMGFTAIARSALERMIARDPPVQMAFADMPASPLFLSVVKDGRCWGEDASFCWRAHAAGVPVLLDTRPRLTHIGRYGYRLEDLGTAPIPHQRAFTIQPKEGSPHEPKPE